MDDDGSYGIVSYREFANLRKEIDELKGNSNKQLIEFIGKINQNMDNLLQIFKSAADEIKLEDSTQSHVIKDYAQLSQKIEILTQQTKTITDKLLALSEVVKEIKMSLETSEEPAIQQKAQQVFQQQQPPLNIPSSNGVQGFNLQQPQIKSPIPPPIPQQAQQGFGRENQLPPFPGDELSGDLGLEPFPPMPEKKRGLFGRFKK